MSHIKTRKYLVTGAGRGIGRALVGELVSLGATVYALSKSEDNLKSLQAQFPNVIPLCVDLSDWANTRKRLEQLEAVDCLINNAAIAISGTFMDMKPEDFDRQINVNLKSVINVSQVVAKKMIERGQGGSIVNISSIAGRKAFFLTSIAYSCTKAALEMLTKIMAIELGAFKIRVNSVCPAGVVTDMSRQFFEMGDEDQGKKEKAEEIFKMLESRTPTKSKFMPMKDVVAAILFLGSDATSQITGESLAVDGGFILT